MTLLLTRSDIAGLLELPALASEIETAFAGRAMGRGLDLLRDHLEGRGGAFHVVAGGTAEPSSAWTVKVNAHFGQPSGLTALFDPATGALVAVMDSAYLTSMRTAAMTVVVVRSVGAATASRALLVGAGRQGAAQVDALVHALPRLERLDVFDVDPAAAVALAGRTGGTAVRDLAAAAQHAEVIVTVTPAREPLLSAQAIRPDALVLAYGADAPGKQEHDPNLLERATVICDIRSQAAASGELQHARPAVVQRATELADVLVRGLPPVAFDGLVVYDATGTATQDAVAASQLVISARRAGRGREIDLTD